MRLLGDMKVSLWTLSLVGQHSIAYLFLKFRYFCFLTSLEVDEDVITSSLFAWCGVVMYNTCNILELGGNKNEFTFSAECQLSLW